MRKVRRAKSRYIESCVLSREHPLPAAPRPFTSVDELLEMGLVMLEVRRGSYEAATDMSSDPDRQKQFKLDSNSRTRHWHRSFMVSGETVPLAANILKAHLNQVEREILLVLLLQHLALLPNRGSTCEEILAHLVMTPRKRMQAMRALTKENRLVRSGFIAVYADYEAPPQWELSLDPVTASMVMHPKRENGGGWPVKTEEALYNHMSHLARVFQQKADKMKDVHRGYGNKSDVYKWQRSMEYLMRGMDQALQQHPEWHLAQVQKEFEATNPYSKEMWVVFLVLLCKELGHVRADDDLFQGINLLRAASSSDILPYRSHNLLGANSFLRSADWMQPCGGADAFMSDEPQDLQESEYELTRNALEKLELQRGFSRRHRSGYELAQPKVRMADLVLAEETRVCLEQAVAQSRYAEVLFLEWGLGERISYGKGVTLMFYGPPGTGKTAGAQALAHTLGKPILAVDYSQIQNCFVGQTEKNIVRIFREAAERDAVLFWDEADAMFFDRDSASHAWEVRDTNVLLQELERFPGTCILATNRVTTLDKALERRISLKVRFDRPGQVARREIFRRMLPATLPLTADVNLDRLAAHDLSGGEIKNVILNAARNALVRSGAEARVCMDDFTSAITTLKQGAWTRNTERIIGFTAS